MSNAIVTILTEQVAELPDEFQQRVLEYVRMLKASARHGVPGKQLLRFAGSIPPDDLELMRQAIAADCEQIDVDEW